MGKVLNTKEVREMGKAFCGKAAQWTDRTLKRKVDRDNKRRSVVWNLYWAKDADALFAHFKAQGIGNKITRTGVDSDIFKHVRGGEYVRVIADLA